MLFLKKHYIFEITQYFALFQICNYSFYNNAHDAQILCEQC